ncbi:MAG: acyltransferase family protein [Bacteroidales bacterium]|nr:acyltransferase family protein [Bacteroidales bacterium]
MITCILLVYAYSLLDIHIIYKQPVDWLHDVRRLFHKEYFSNIPIWFLLCLFEINIFFYLIHLSAYKLFRHYQILAICLISLTLGAIGQALSHSGINIPFFIDSAITSLPFYAFGYVCFRHTNIIKPNSSDKYIPFFLVALFLFVFYFAPDGIVNTHLPSDTYRLFLFHISGFAGALFVILLSKWIKYGSSEKCVGDIRKKGSSTFW